MQHGISVRRLTAQGRGAVAVLSVRAQTPENAIRLNECFVALNGTKPATAPVGRILYGNWGREDVVVVRVGELEWEVNCHGGEAAVSAIRNSLNGGDSEPSAGRFVGASTGARLEEALLSLLLQCRTRQTAEYVLAQQQGVLRRFLETLATCDSDNNASELVQQALGWRRLASHLVLPWQVAVVGQPNVGKSSLLNAIVGYQRSIVFDQPVTTRDRVEAEVFLEGFPYLLTDTAGIRETTNEIESMGVAEARMSISASDACLLVVDATKPWTSTDADLLASVSIGRPVAVLRNKVDLLGNFQSSFKQLNNSSETALQPIVLETSAVNGQGIDELLSWLTNALVPNRPSLGDALLVIPELAEALESFYRTRNKPELHEALDHWLA